MQPIIATHFGVVTSLRGVSGMGGRRVGLQPNPIDRGILASASPIATMAVVDRCPGELLFGLVPVRALPPLSNQKKRKQAGGSPLPYFAINNNALNNIRFVGTTLVAFFWLRGAVKTSPLSQKGPAITNTRRPKGPAITKG